MLNPLGEQPQSWCDTTIGEVCTLINGRGFRKTERSAEGLPIIRIQNLKDPDADFNYYDGEFQEKILITSGDLLFAWSGTPGTSFGAFQWFGPTGLLNQHIFKVLVEDGIVYPEFFKFALNNKLAELIGQAQGGVGLRHITKKVLTSTRVALPPLNEQRRIIAKIEALQERSRKAQTALEAIPPLLENFRRSVLAAAFRGDLTADWRARHPNVEPASVLLERILAERHRRWGEAELAKMTAKGKVPKNDKWKSKYKEPIAPDVEGLPELPDGWCWATVDQVGVVQGGIQKGKKRTSETELVEVPYLRVANVQRGYLDLEEVTLIEATEKEIQKLRLETGDILFNEGGDRDKLGRGWIWMGEIATCIHQNHVFRVRLISTEIAPRWVSWYGNTEAQTYFFESGTQTTNLASLNSTKLRSLPLPIPPTAEQDELVGQIGRFLEQERQLSRTVESVSEQVRRLDSSIVRQAFQGKLVPQDPNDEPASVLLERIRKAREAEPPKKKRRKTKR